MGSCFGAERDYLRMKESVGSRGVNQKFWGLINGEF